MSLAGRKLNIGLTTRGKVNKLLEEGDITPQHVEKLHASAMAFLTTAVAYALKKLPLKEPLLQHAKFVDVHQRSECDIQDVHYFIDR